jgi:hypothetical protein
MSWLSFYSGTTSVDLGVVSIAKCVISAYSHNHEVSVSKAVRSVA